MKLKCPTPVVLTAAISLTSVLVPSAVAAPAARSVTGFVFGPIVKVNAAGFQLTTSITSSGTSTVKLTSATEISEQREATQASLTKGVCVMAFGSTDSKGKVRATSVTISRPSKGQCNGGFGGRRGSGPPGGSGAPPQRPAGSAPPGQGAGRPTGNFGLAVGKLISVGKQTFKVRGTIAGKKVERLVSVTRKTTFQQIASVGGKSIKTKTCASVVGTSSDNGLTVKAQTIRLSAPSSGGCSGFPLGR